MGAESTARAEASDAPDITNAPLQVRASALNSPGVLQKRRLAASTPGKGQLQLGFFTSGISCFSHGYSLVGSSGVRRELVVL